ncbi:B-type lectin plumieribetin-like [Gadus macrocephalus]|uniref:B-type lectin plumieribetin-like n=1 Tax=Gadus macrocephalus TaxID=80720 RepID=UPI0028CB8D99|nr:B-type lectin plumieribetin-like [Gadus macrocephalus]
MINSRGALHLDSQTCNSSRPSFNSCIICHPRNMSRNSLSANQQLFKGDFLMSNNQEYKAIFQDDGNFVIYKWSPIWATNTECGPAFRVIMQEDSNLVVCTKEDEPVWASNSAAANCNQVRLTLTNKGELVTSKKGVETWSSSCP